MSAPPNNDPSARWIWRSVHWLQVGTVVFALFALGSAGSLVIRARLELGHWPVRGLPVFIRDANPGHENDDPWPGEYDAHYDWAVEPIEALYGSWDVLALLNLACVVYSLVARRGFRTSILWALSFLALLGAGLAVVVWDPFGGPSWLLE